MVLLTITLTLCLGFSLLEFRSSSDKLRHFLFVIASIFVFVLMGLNRMNPDYDGYYGSYYNGNSGHEIGYQLLNRLFRALQLPFESLMILMSILLISVIWIGMKGHYSSWVLLFYAIFPLALDLPQMRNTFMYLIVILALLLFANRSRLAFFISVVVAASMHMIGAFYLSLTFLFKTNRKTFFKWIGILGAGLLIGAIGLRVANLLWTLHPEIAEEIRPYDHFLFAVQVVEIAIDLFTYWWIDRKIRNRMESKTLTKMENLYRFGWYSALYIPLLLVHGQMYRIRRNAQLAKYIYSGIAMKYLSRKDKLILIGLISLNLLLVIVMMIKADDHSVYFWFDHNWLFETIQNIFA